MMPGADLFPGDSIQVTEEWVANIVVSGSSVLVAPNALVKFMGNAVDSPMGRISCHFGGMAVWPDHHSGRPETIKV